jgi:hypothetical protein
LAGKEKSISGCEQTAGTLQWDTMSVSSVKLGEFEIYQFGGNRRFFKHQFADAQSGDVLPTFEPGRIPDYFCDFVDFSCFWWPKGSKLYV